MQKTSPIAFLTLTLAMFVSGCTHLIQPPSTAFTNYPEAHKVNLKVGLHLSGELRKSQWKKSSMGDIFIIPIGTNLCLNAEAMSRRLFSEVETSDEPDKLIAAGMDAILTPNLAYINRTTGATSFGDSVVAIKVEWTLTDSSGKTLWADTISGEGKGSTGWTNPKNIVKLSVEDLFAKWYQTISSSTAIKKFAQDHGTTN